MNYNRNRTTRILQAFSQLGHAICGGSADISISQRVGYMTSHVNKDLLDYLEMQIKIDKAFDPIDGKNHCQRAYETDLNEDYIIGLDDPKFNNRIKMFVTVFVPIIKIAVWFIKRKK